MTRLAREFFLEYKTCPGKISGAGAMVHFKCRKANQGVATIALEYYDQTESFVLTIREDTPWAASRIYDSKTEFEIANRGYWTLQGTRVDLVGHDWDFGVDESGAEKLGDLLIGRCGA